MYVFRSACFRRGPHTLNVPMKLHEVNRERLCEALKVKLKDRGALIVLQGGDIHQLYDIDRNIVPFRQVCHLLSKVVVLMETCQVNPRLLAVMAILMLELGIHEDNVMLM